MYQNNNKIFIYTKTATVCGGTLDLIENHETEERNVGSERWIFSYMSSYRGRKGNERGNCSGTLTKRQTGVCIVFMCHIFIPISGPG